LPPQLAPLYIERELAFQFACGINICFLFVQEFFIQNEEMSPAFQTFLHLMYDREVFDEGVIFDWFKTPSQDDSLGNENQEKIREQVGHTDRLTGRQRDTTCNKPAANLLYPIVTTCYQTYQNVFK
jgi:hypothetical protein